MNIKAVGFDYGGVIGMHKPIMPRISEIINMPLEELKAIYFQHNKLANVGDISYRELWGIILAQTNKTKYLKEVLDYLVENGKADNNIQVINIIDELRNSGIKVGLLSNNTRSNGVVLREEGLDKHFDVFLISAEIGFQKPDPQAFNVLFEQLEMQPSETAYIDDTEQSLRGASDIGYHSILYKNAEQLRTDLVSLGVLKV